MTRLSRTFSLLAVLVIASQAVAAQQTQAAPAQFHKYVALGDSYASAPGVGPGDASSGNCARSLRNYPSQVADALGLARGESFIDVTCSGASSYAIADGGSDPLGGQRPAQLDALTPDTDLVTLTAGADNDGLATAIFFDCNLRAGSGGPDGHTCEDSVSSSPASDLDESLARTKQSLVGVLAQIHQSAPKAVVLIVPYLRLGAEWCPEWSPFSKNDVQFIAGTLDRINSVLKGAAAAGGARFVDIYAASAGHEVCSATPWAKGGGSLFGSDIALHPLPAGEDGMARATLKALGR